MPSTVIQQLDQVRRTGRWLLVTQRWMQWVGTMTAVAIALGLIDFLLRFPGWLRLICGLVVLGVAAAWLVTRLFNCLKFRPSLGQLALRAERLYPQLAGSLATAVEFTLHADQFKQPPRTAQLAAVSVQQVSTMLEGVQMMKLLDLSRTVRLLIDMSVVLAVLGALVIVAPQKTQIAAARWFMPMGSTQWPKRTEVVGRVLSSVWPTDAPLRLSAAVRRGHRDGMRVWASYRFEERGGRLGPWQSVLMNEQSGGLGLFERVIDMPPALIRDIERDPMESEAAVQFRFEAGDDVTQTTRFPLVARPVIREVHASVAPPAYAAGLVSEQHLDLLTATTSVATTTALAGSSIRMAVHLNKPVNEISAATTTAGLADAVLTLDHERSFTVRFKLNQTMESPIELTDEHGLTNLSEQRYRFEAVEDKPPTVSMVQPSADEAVLPSARVGVEALAQDDVGLQQLVIEAEIPNHPDSQSDQTTVVKTLVDRSVRQALAAAQTDLDLEPFGLRPGQVVVLSAAAQDVFDMEDKRHASVRSVPRHLRIIDAATLVGQLRGELAILRRNAIRIERTQRKIVELDSARALPQQDQVSQRLSNQGALLQRLLQRAQKNRLEDRALGELIKNGSQLVKQAVEYSALAQQQLRATEAAQARPSQDQVTQSLQELVALLDQGRDALTLQLALRQLKTQQESVAQDTRRLLPRTVGRETSELPDALRHRLAKLAARQAALGGQAGQMIRQMQATAEALARQGQSDRDAAAAEALAEAAAIAQRQGLSESMQTAADSAGQNQLSQSGQQQSDALETMGKMLSQFGQQDQLMQAILQRRLQELAAALEKLIQRQEGQMAALDISQIVTALESGQAALRRATMATQDQALDSEKTRSVGPMIGDAVIAQGEAIVSLRDSASAPARLAQSRALSYLEDALEQVRKASEHLKQEATSQQRDELEQAYSALAVEQTELSKQTAQIVDAGPVSRAQRGHLNSQAQQQQQVRDRAFDLGERVGETLVFKHVHGRIDHTAQRVVTALQDGEVDSSLVADQKQISRHLVRMAEALADDLPQGKFAEGSGGSGGGAGGGAAQSDVVPPIAELRLIRGIQQSIHEATRGFDSSSNDPRGAMMHRRLRELSTRQRELSGLGQELIERVDRDLQVPAESEKGKAR